MKLNSKQVADKLGVSISTIRTLVARNLITDLGKTKEGAIKHEYIFDSKEINEFAKSYKRHSHKNGKVVGSSSPTGLISKLENRLSKIENKIDKLLTIWS